ncbi:MAG TPA: LysR family transcriptional regulator [Ramlibacter sp.]
MELSASTVMNRLLTRGKFRHVQVVLKLAELGSVQRTADAIGMTQSSVTQTLAYLERLLETQLFQRHARGVRPTAAGAQLLPIARQLLHGMTDGAEVIASHHRQGEGLVRLVASGAATHGLLVKALPRFNAQAPQVQVQLREAEGEDQLLAIARGEVDLVACRKPPVVPEGWRFQPLLADRFAIVCRADNPLVRARRVTWTQLAAETWMLLPTGLAGRERFDGFLERFPRPPKMHPLVTRSPAMMSTLLLQCGLLALLPFNLVRPLMESGELAELRIGEAMPMEPLGLLQPQGGAGAAATLLADFLGVTFTRGK